MVRRWSLTGHFLILYYPTVAQVVGMSPLRAAVPQWSDLEHQLYAFFAWVPDGIPAEGMLAAAASNPRNRYAHTLTNTAKLMERCSDGVEDQGAGEAVSVMGHAEVEESTNSVLERAALPFTAPSLIPTVNGNTVSQLSLRTDNCPQPKQAQLTSHALTSD
jgi:hypothetical protein